MKPDLTKKKNRQRAQAMVEFALVFPLLVVLMYSLLEFGRLLFIYISVINSSREAARYGSSVGNIGSYRYVDCSGMINAARRSAILNTIDPSAVTITYDQGPGTGALFGGAVCGNSIIDPNDIKLGNRVNVQVTLIYTPLMPVQWASFPITARSARTILKSVEVAGDNIGELGTPSVQFTGPGGDTYNEGDTVNVQLVMLPNASTDIVNVTLTLNETTAGAADVNMAYTVSFAAGEQYKTLPVQLLLDLCDEEEVETLEIRISAVDGGALKGYPLVYTIHIRDVDPTPTLFFELASSSVNEEAGSAPVNVRLSAVSCLDVSFRYEASGGTATKDVDYSLPTMPVTIPAGQPGVATALTIIDDATYETDETAILQLTPLQNADLGAPASHTLTIVNTDPPPVVSFDVATSISSEEVGVMRIYARLNRVSAVNANVILSVVNSGTTATSGTDYVVTTGPLTIPAGSLEKEIVITIVNDIETKPEDLEEPETLQLRLTLPVSNANATIGSPSNHVLTIKETSTQPQVGFLSPGKSVDESAGVVLVRVVLSEAFTADVAVQFAINGSATAGFDYSGVTNSPVVIKAGAVSKDILLPVIDDRFDELDETVIFTITAAPGAVVPSPNPTHTVLILDNDDPPVVAFVGSGKTVEEGSGLMNVDVFLTQASNLPITVGFAPGGNARPTDDYTVITASPLSFPAGTTSRTIQLNLVDDTIFTGSRQLLLTLGSPVNVTLGNPQVYTITIVDNEVCPTLTGWTLDGKNGYTTVSLPVDAPPIQLVSMTVTQETGQQLKQVDMGTNNTIYQGTANGSPVTITTFKNGADLTLSGAAGGRVILLSFKDTVALTGQYSLSLTWSNGCVISKP